MENISYTGIKDRSDKTVTGVENMDPLEKAQKEKIVFYLHKKQSIGGGLVFYMNLASAIAELGKYKVYYINIPNADLE